MQFEFNQFLPLFCRALANRVGFETRRRKQRKNRCIAMLLDLACGVFGRRTKQHHSTGLKAAASQRCKSLQHSSYCAQPGGADQDSARTQGTQQHVLQAPFIEWRKGSTVRLDKKPSIRGGRSRPCAYQG